MKNTEILMDIDFNPNSVYRSHEAEAKLSNWTGWEEVMLTEKEKQEIARALKKM